MMQKQVHIVRTTQYGGAVYGGTLEFICVFSIDVDT